MICLNWEELVIARINYRLYSIRMNKYVATAVAAFTALSFSPQAQAEGEWGCTVFLCLASPTNPMAIKDCAAALLQIRPWKSPTCPAAKITNIRVKEATEICPIGYDFLREDFERDVREDNLTRPQLSSLADGYCINPEGSIEPSGAYRQSVMEYYDHDGVRRVYRIAF